MAAHSGHADVVELLLERGAAINSQDNVSGEIDDIYLWCLNSPKIWWRLYTCVYIFVPLLLCLPYLPQLMCVCLCALSLCTDFIIFFINVTRKDGHLSYGLPTPVSWSLFGCF